MPISSAPMSSQLSSLPEGTLERLDLSAKVKNAIQLETKMINIVDMSTRIRQVILLNVEIFGA